MKPTFHQKLTGACYLPFYVDGLTAVVALILGEYLGDGQCALVCNVTDLEVLKHQQLLAYRKLYTTDIKYIVFNR